MTEKVESAKPAKAAAPKAESPAAKPVTIKPLYAIHRIVYGDKKVAAGDTIFAPTTEKEREDILRLGAGRELNEVEEIVASQMKFDAPAPAAGEDFA